MCCLPVQSGGWQTLSVVKSLTCLWMDGYRRGQWNPSHCVQVETAWSSVCLSDPLRALELQPYSLKPLLRRAMAYESLERYKKAYVDYKTVLQIDNGVQAAHDSIHRSVGNRTCKVEKAAVTVIVWPFKCHYPHFMHSHKCYFTYEGLMRDHPILSLLFLWLICVHF